MKGTPGQVSVSSVTGNQTWASVLLDCLLFAFCEQTFKLLSSIPAPGAVLLRRLLPLTRQWGFSSSSLLSRLQQQQHQTWPLRCDQAEPSSPPLISWRAASAAWCPRFTMCTPPPLPPTCKDTAFALWIAGGTCWLGGSSARGKCHCTFYHQIAQRGEC